MTIAKTRTKECKRSVSKRVFDEQQTMTTTDGRVVPRYQALSGTQWRARINTAKIMERLQTNAMGRLQYRRSGVDAMVTWLFAAIGQDFNALPPREQYRLKEECRVRIENMEMSMAQVRSAEIILRKVVPDLAQVEHRGNSPVQNVVILPQRSADSAAWAETARKVIEHEPAAEDRVAAATGAAEPAAVVSG